MDDGKRGTSGVHWNLLKCSYWVRTSISAEQKAQHAQPTMYTIF
jgi:hypothetical protein